MWPDGRRYEGDFKENKMSGFGRFDYGDGKVYEGEFLNGKQHGTGFYTSGDRTR